MSDIQRAQNDFQIVNGDLLVIENSQSVVQEVIERLQSFAFEWFLDEEGLPYFEELVGKGNNISYLKNIILDTVTRTNGVHSVEDFDITYDTITRNTNVHITIKTIYDEVKSLTLKNFGQLETLADSSIVLDIKSQPIRDIRSSLIRDIRKS